MTTATLYFVSSVGGSVATPANALGVADGVFTADANTATSWTHRWRLDTVAGSNSPGGTQSITLVMRKGSNSGDPTVASVTLYQADAAIGALTLSTGSTTISSTSGQELVYAFDGALLSGMVDVDIEVATAAAGGEPSARNAASIDSGTWAASYTEGATASFSSASGQAQGASAGTTRQLTAVGAASQGQSATMATARSVTATVATGQGQSGGGEVLLVPPTVVQQSARPGGFALNTLSLNSVSAGSGLALLSASGQAQTVQAAATRSVTAAVTSGQAQSGAGATSRQVSCGIATGQAQTSAIASSRGITATSGTAQAQGLQAVASRTVTATSVTAQSQSAAMTANRTLALTVATHQIQQVLANTTRSRTATAQSSQAQSSQVTAWRTVLLALASAQAQQSAGVGGSSVGCSIASGQASSAEAGFMREVYLLAALGQIQSVAAELQRSLMASGASHQAQTALLRSTAAFASDLRATVAAQDIVATLPEQTARVSVPFDPLDAVQPIQITEASV